MIKLRPSARPGGERFLIGFVGYAGSCCAALFLGVMCNGLISGVFGLTGLLEYAPGVLLTGAFAGALAALVGHIGRITPPWRRRWTVGVAALMWLFATWVAVDLWLHPEQL